MRDQKVQFFLNWSPFLATAGVILYFSSQPVLPAPISAQTPSGENLRQFIHVGEYFVLGFFLYYALARRNRDRMSAFVPVFLALGGGILFALLDEWHQHFIPHRDMSWTDVTADALGISLGVGLAWAVKFFFGGSRWILTWWWSVLPLRDYMQRRNWRVRASTWASLSKWWSWHRRDVP